MQKRPAIYLAPLDAFSVSATFFALVMDPVEQTPAPDHAFTPQSDLDSSVRTAPGVCEPCDLMRPRRTIIKRLDIARKRRRRTVFGRSELRPHPFQKRAALFPAPLPPFTLQFKRHLDAIQFLDHRCDLRRSPSGQFKDAPSLRVVSRPFANHAHLQSAPLENVT